MKNFDYYYGVEAEQFSFYRIPRLLIKDKKFKGISNDAKLLYGLMLDRMSLSMKNGWLDEDNRVYIIYTISTIMEDLSCGKDKAIKVLAELDSIKGVGLIEKIRRGFGKPDIIYIKNFISLEDDTEEEYSNNDDITEVEKKDFKKSEKQSSEGSENRLQKVGKADSNYTNISYTNKSYNNLINQSTVKIDEIDNINTYTEIIKENIEYEHYMEYAKYDEKDLYQELYEIICEIVCIKHKTVRIGRDEYPYELVRARFLKLKSSHLQYVIECMQKNTNKIGNIKAYMITALYNAPNTISHYYQQEVQHDMYGI